MKYDTKGMWLPGTANPLEKIDADLARVSDPRDRLSVIKGLLYAVILVQPLCGRAVPLIYRLLDALVEDGDPFGLIDRLTSATISALRNEHPDCEVMLSDAGSSLAPADGTAAADWLEDLTDYGGSITDKAAGLSRIWSQELGCFGSITYRRYTIFSATLNWLSLNAGRSNHASIALMEDCVEPMRRIVAEAADSGDHVHLLRRFLFADAATYFE